jgi:transcriptional regulator with XRE-family HTH domain
MKAEMKDLQKVLRCNDQEMKKLARKMSETVILGSMEIWRNNVKQIERGNREDANDLITDEEASMEEIRVDLEREQNTRNAEHRNQIEEDRDIFNEIEADRDAEEFEDDEEEEEKEEENGQEDQEEEDKRRIIGNMDDAADDEADDHDEDLQ